MKKSRLLVKIEVHKSQTLQHKYENMQKDFILLKRRVYNLFSIKPRQEQLKEQYQDTMKQIKFKELLVLHNFLQITKKDKNIQNLREKEIQNKRDVKKVQKSQAQNLQDQYAQILIELKAAQKQMHDIEKQKNKLDSENIYLQQQIQKNSSYKNIKIKINLFQTKILQNQSFIKILHQFFSQEVIDKYSGKKQKIRRNSQHFTANLHMKVQKKNKSIQNFQSYKISFNEKSLNLKEFILFVKKFYSLYVNMIQQKHQLAQQLNAKIGQQKKQKHKAIDTLKQLRILSNQQLKKKHNQSQKYIQLSINRIHNNFDFILGLVEFSKCFEQKTFAIIKKIKFICQKVNFEIFGEEIIQRDLIEIQKKLSLENKLMNQESLFDFQSQEVLVQQIEGNLNKVISNIRIVQFHKKNYSEFENKKMFNTQNQRRFKSSQKNIKNMSFRNNGMNMFSRKMLVSTRQLNPRKASNRNTKQYKQRNSKLIKEQLADLNKNNKIFQIQDKSYVTQKMNELLTTYSQKNSLKKLSFRNNQKSVKLKNKISFNLMTTNQNILKEVKINKKINLHRKTQSFDKRTKKLYFQTQMDQQSLYLKKLNDQQKFISNLKKLDFKINRNSSKLLQQKNPFYNLSTVSYHIKKGTLFN